MLKIRYLMFTPIFLFAVISVLFTRLWKSKEDKTNVVPDENQHIYTSDVELRNPEDELDLRRLISSASDNDALDIRINETISKKNGDDDPDINLREQDNNTHACASVRLCLEAAYIPTDKSTSSVIRSQLEIAKDALRNPSAQTFLISVLSQRRKFHVITFQLSFLTHNRCFGNLTPFIFQIE